MIVGAVPIYVDKECRDDFIPKGTMMVNKLFKGLKELDKYESIPNSNSNFFVEEAKSVRKRDQISKKDLPDSFLSQQP